MNKVNSINSQYDKKFISDLKKILNNETGFKLILILNQYLYTTSSYNKHISDNLIENNNLIRNEIIEDMVNILIQSEEDSSLEYNTNIREIGVYTTGEVAKYMDISVQTVNEWIKAGKIYPAHRTNGTTGQWRIPVDAKVRLRSGKEYSLKEVVEEKEIIMKRSRQAAYNEEIKCIEEELAFYEKKYSNYFELLYNKNRTEEEEKDLKQWLYWQQRYIEEDDLIRAAMC